MLHIDGILLIIFIVLKLVGVIAWSWLWVLSPLWIGVLLILFISFIGATAGKSEWNK